MSCLEPGWVALVVAAVGALAGWVVTQLQLRDSKKEAAALRAHIESKQREVIERRTQIDAVGSRRREYAAGIARKEVDRSTAADERRDPPTEAAAIAEAEAEAQHADAMADAFDQASQPCPTCGKFGNPLCPDAYHLRGSVP